MKDYSEYAKELFRQGYNCSQSVLCAFCDRTGLDFETSAKIASSFGGGMGRLREVCGAVSGMFMAAGLIYGYSDSKAVPEKAEHYKLIQALAGKFKAENGSIICRQLLGLENSGASSPVPEKRTDEYYKKRPCIELVGDAARILSEFICEADKKSPNE